MGNRFHTGAFKRLRNGNYDKYIAMTKEYNKEGEFLTFTGYECHSMEHGDHVALWHDIDVPLVECTSVEDWKQKLKNEKVFITPHHMGYQEGYRGYNWKFFTEGDQTPFVEMYSRHGLAESDMGDYHIFTIWVHVIGKVLSSMAWNKVTNLVLWVLPTNIPAIRKLW